MGRSNPCKSITNSNATAQRSLGILAAAFLLVATAHGRIGQSEAEIRARYGDPLIILPARTEAGLTKCYVSDGFSIAVTYVDGRSAREMLAKADKSKISEKEIRRLLEANAGGSSWKREQLDGHKNVAAGLVEWRTNSQRSRVAFYDSLTQAFFVTTQNYINATNAANRQAIANANRKGLLSHREAERALRNLQKSNIAGSLGRGQAAPSPSPAAK